MTLPTEVFYPSHGHSAFRQDKYYQFTKTTVTVMAGWPRILAWKRSARKMPWRMYRPDCHVSSRDPMPCGEICGSSGSVERGPLCQRGEGDCIRMHDAWAQWCALIPLEIRQLVARYRKRQWHLLSLAARCGKPAIDLMHSNPALAWALASSWVFREKPVRDPMRSARRLLAPGKSQRDILRWLDFPDTDRARKIMRKLRVESIDVYTLFSLRSVMRIPQGMKYLSHLPEINAGVVQLLEDSEVRPWCAMSLLLEVSAARDRRLEICQDDGSLIVEHRTSEDRYARTARIMRDCLAMMDYLGLDRTLVRPLRSCAEVDGWHRDLLSQQLRAEEPAIRSDARVELPDPPIPGTAEILPLTTRRCLVEEGRHMQHCVGSYGDVVARGRAYVYRVLAPERATLAIGTNPGSQNQKSRWRVLELKLAGNQEPAKTTYDAVNRWLQGIQLEA